MQDLLPADQSFDHPALDYATWSPKAVQAGRFNLYDRALLRNKVPTFNRRDFYKISLLTGTSRFDYAHRGVLIDRPALVFSNPLIPYAWQAISQEQGGYLCLFAEDFLLGANRTASLQQSPLFQLDSNPVFFLDEAQYADLSYLFRQMLKELEGGYEHKQDLLRSYVHIVLHEALKLQPRATYYQHPPGAGRVVALFFDLLERQFPIDSPDRALRLRAASDFAAHLSVHVNHLNRAVRQLTGQTTTAHIATRLVAEAKALLQHTSWNTAEIAYGLGFEHPTNFNNFFKKHTGQTPLALRASLMGNQP
ncbi:MAG: helix-turn-helix domain-containing protein [Janthinobacterium lividum]